MEINDIHKYCHVSTFHGLMVIIATPVYVNKLLNSGSRSPNTHHSLLLDKITSLLKNNGFKVEFKS